MPRKLVTGTYIFCTNSHYYEAIVQYVKGKSDKVINEANCENIILDEKSDQIESAKEICQEFKFLYKSFGEYHGKKISEAGTLTDYDCNFLNYWLNDKIKKTVNDDTNYVKEFYKKIKERDNTFFSNSNDLEKHLYVIDPKILENMKLLYDLYGIKKKITDLIFDQDNTADYKELCKEYTKECYDKYIEGMKKCLNIYDDFYKALKVFETDYKYLIAQETDKSGQCKTSDQFRLMEYDPVLEAHQRRIMTFKIMSAPLMLPFVIPLLYKFTPFGPFLRSKIRMVKDKWMNMDKNESELLSLSTDIENNISDNEEFNLGYYSVTS
ncbi:PIR Superfamily Protein [Plasmodium ovale wallikeri]|uniref:PIR Superfamily Protein n=2 Tax=Plasmodium ovale TaxID=36330 RepID=A0A1A9AII7_PLAOA|nr:PIR Superfamily Protein [Plasmodium ovale wallikeri]SBT56418.1 PIR Superfamily Protein [Plasmodium ovale wallikeri]SBT72073.1 PIR protein [Plasmodium ovale]